MRINEWGTSKDWQRDYTAEDGTPDWLFKYAIYIFIIIYFIYLSASPNNMELYFYILDVALSLPEMIF